MNEQGWEARFWAKVDVRGKDECWEWKASIRGGGYGHFRVEEKSCSAHRLAWELANGPIPEGLCVLHHCDNKRCVNPAHHWPGSQVDNLRDMKEKGRARGGSLRGAKNPSSKLTREKVRQIRRLYATDRYSQQALSTHFSISDTLVGNIVRRESWAWLD